jgi:hypothetical protein
LLLGSCIVNGELLAEANAPRGSLPNTVRAASAACEPSVGAGRLVSIIQASDFPHAVDFRCAYALLGRPVRTGTIRCVDGQWHYNASVVHDLSCVP